MIQYMKKITLVAVCVSCVATLGSYWYWSPLLALQQMRSAVEAKNSYAFDSYVDYKKLRENIKRQLVVTMFKASKDDTIAASLADRYLEDMVQPKAVMARFDLWQLEARARDNATHGTTGPALIHSTERPTSSHFISSLYQEGEPPDQRLNLVLERSGFATWKLTSIQVMKPRAM